MRATWGSETGRTYLLTGATGFLGKVLLEELLRRREELRLDRVYLLIRPRGALSARERFWREVAVSDCFSRLPPNWTDSVVVAEGRLEAPGLDLEQGLGGEIASGVTHMLHAAASTDFHQPLESAAKSNIAASLNLLELARSCSSLQKLVCISTAYVTPYPGEDVAIEERLASLPGPAEEIYESILDGTAVERELLERSGHPNTYTLTKSLAEHLLVARSGDVPLAIVRPSIISSSRRYPFPGWIDSTDGFASFVIMLGMGHMRAIVVENRDSKLDLIPVDEVARRVLLACQTKQAPGAAAPIHHAVAGLERSASIWECWRGIQDFYSVHRIDRLPAMRYMGPPGLRYDLAHALHHRMPQLSGRLRARRYRSRGQVLSRLTYLNTAFPYFMQSFDFRSAHAPDTTFDPRAYVATVSRGVYRHILRRDDSEWILGGRRHQGYGGDMRWARRQPNGSGAIRVAGWLINKVLRRCFERVTVDIPSFEPVRRVARVGVPLVIVPTHRSFFDFVLCSYLFFARPDLRIPIPHIAAAIEFSHIPVLGKLLTSLQAFYLQRGEGCDHEELARRVRELITGGDTLEFFIEGTRSRSRRFLPPKRGMLRCVQATGENCIVVPVSISYDRVVEEKAFAKELAGAPKPKMRLSPLLGWILKMLRGQIDLGRAHIACGDVVRIGPDSDAHAIGHQLVDRLRGATVTTTFHLRGFLQRHPIEGVDATWLRGAIEQRGGRVLDSKLEVPDDLDPLIAATFRHQFAHLFADETAADGRLGRLARALARPDGGRPADEKRVA